MLKHRMVVTLIASWVASAALLTAGARPAAAAFDDKAAAKVVTVLVTEGGKKLAKALRSTFSQHARFHPEGNIAIVPLADLGGSRLSYNLVHKDWVPRGSKPIQVRVTIHGVSDQVRDGLRLVLKADKRGQDRDRNDGKVFGHGAEITISYGTSGDRANYLVERGSNLAKQLPAGAYVRFERLN